MLPMDYSYDYLMTLTAPADSSAHLESDHSDSELSGPDTQPDIVPAAQLE